jgi:hypothetical protein
MRHRFRRTLRETRQLEDQNAEVVVGLSCGSYVASEGRAMSERRSNEWTGRLLGEKGSGSCGGVGLESLGLVSRTALAAALGTRSLRVLRP